MFGGPHITRDLGQLVKTALVADVAIQAERAIVGKPQYDAATQLASEYTPPAEENGAQAATYRPPLSPSL